MQVSYSKLKQSSAELHSTYKNIDETLNNIGILVNQISNSGCWSGNASEYYISKLRAMTSEFDGMLSELEKSALYLDKTIVRYESFENKIIQGLGNTYHSSK